MRPRIQAIVDELVEAARERRTFDLLADLIEPLPVTVVAGMLGIPASDRHLLRPWSADICKMYELNPSLEMQQDSVRASAVFVRR